MRLKAPCASQAFAYVRSVLCAAQLVDHPSGDISERSPIICWVAYGGTPSKGPAHLPPLTASSGRLMGFVDSKDVPTNGII